MNGYGLQSLTSRRRPGRPAKLTPAQWRRGLTQLQRGAPAFGFETERRTLRRLRQLIQGDCGVTYYPHYLGDKLRRLGWSPRPPAVYGKERDDALVMAWFRHDWPRIKKARRRAATLVFIDEVGWSFQARWATTWSPIGQRPSDAG